MAVWREIVFCKLFFFEEEEEEGDDCFSLKYCAFPDLSCARAHFVKTMLEGKGR